MSSARAEMVLHFCARSRFNDEVSQYIEGKITLFILLDWHFNYM